jgi:hypothetical protein
MDVVTRRRRQLETSLIGFPVDMRHDVITGLGQRLHQAPVVNGRGVCKHQKADTHDAILPAAHRIPPRYGRLLPTLSSIRWTRNRLRVYRESCIVGVDFESTRRWP